MSAVQRHATAIFAVIAAASLLAACAAPATPPPVPQAQAAPVRAAPATLRVPGLKDLTGLHEREILTMLGKPDLRRDEPPARLWQYRTADCVLNLFFYRGADGYQLVHAEAWARSFAPGAAAARCRDESALLRAHRALQSAL